MRLVVDVVPKNVLECDIIESMTMHCPLSHGDCDIWLRGECLQLISLKDCLREDNEEAGEKMEGHNHDS